MILAPLLFAASVLVGYLAEEARERWFWRRLTIRTFTSAPVSTQMPTVAELHHPTWTEDA